MNGHRLDWETYAALAFKMKCECGWKGKRYIMERDALAEGVEHVTKDQTTDLTDDSV